MPKVVRAKQILDRKPNVVKLTAINNLVFSLFKNLVSHKIRRMERNHALVGKAERLYRLQVICLS